MSYVQKNSGQGRLTRRDILAGAAAVVGAAALPGVVQGQGGLKPGSIGRVVKNGRIKQSICGGCLRKAGLDAEQTAKLLVEMGLVGRDL
ncbi:MAG TPA: twin-arginine translocation signal domain-containing protein, partial [Sedimentisphaerales bacterium]|nr:twin-arginine translocation signal domain-containing protein [Sedimentisphaerales bacterium]